MKLCLLELLLILIKQNIIRGVNEQFLVKNGHIWLKNNHFCLFFIKGPVHDRLRYKISCPMKFFYTNQTKISLKYSAYSFWSKRAIFWPENYLFCHFFIIGIVNNKIEWTKLCPLELLYDSIQTKISLGYVAIVAIDAIFDEGYPYRCLKKRLDLRIAASKAKYAKRNY